MYSWNPAGNFRWYVSNSGLNAVELNMSFYRFPFPNQIKSWARYGSKLAWAVKVNRLITHVFKLSERALQSWKKFRLLFEPLDKYIHFYLFQLPPTFSFKLKNRVEKFYKQTGLGKRFALEVRHISWFNRAAPEWAKKLGLTLVSVDSPDFPRDIYCTSGRIYLRMHGRTAWYSHYYTDNELREVARKILRVRPDKVYVYFNNNRNMLHNARSFLTIFLEEFQSLST